MVALIGGVAGRAAAAGVFVGGAVLAALIGLVACFAAAGSQRRNGKQRQNQHKKNGKPFQRGCLLCGSGDLRYPELLCPLSK